MKIQRVHKKVKTFRTPQRWWRQCYDMGMYTNSYYLTVTTWRLLISYSAIFIMSVFTKTHLTTLFQTAKSQKTKSKHLLSCVWFTCFQPNEVNTFSYSSPKLTAAFLLGCICGTFMYANNIDFTACLSIIQVSEDSSNKAQKKNPAAACTQTRKQRLLKIVWVISEQHLCLVEKYCLLPPTHQCRQCACQHHHWFCCRQFFRSFW